MLLSPFCEAKQIMGRVIDGTTKEPISFVQIYNKTTGRGTTSDELGKFSLAVESRQDSIIFQYIGYKQIIIQPPTSTLYLTIELFPLVYNLGDIVIRAKGHREKYRKRGNPAVTLIRNVIEHKDENRFREWETYKTSVYDKIVVSLMPIDFDVEKAALWKNMPFIKKYIDTLDGDSSQSLLRFFISETTKEEFYHCKKGKRQTIVTASRRNGIEKIIDFGNLENYTQIIFKPIDVFDNQISFINSEFVGPLSSTLAVQFYKYYIIDTVLIDGLRCVNLAFVPSNTESFGFVGNLYIVDDGSYALRRVDMHLPFNINMNWVKSLHIREDFSKQSHGAWLPQKVEMDVNFSIVNRATHSLFGQMVQVFENYAFDAETSIRDFRKIKNSATVIENNRRFAHTFDTLRPVPLNAKEILLDSLYSDIMNVNKMRHLVNTIKAFVHNYVPTKRPADSSKWDFGPIFNTISYHNQEGVRLRVGWMTTANLNKRWFAYLYVAYGFKDKRVKGRIDIIHSFTPKQYHPYEPLRNNLTLTLQYDLENLGESRLLSDRDGFGSFSYKAKVTPMQYIGMVRLKYEKQWSQGIRWTTFASVKFTQPNGSSGAGTGYYAPYFDRSPLTLKFFKRNEDGTIIERPFYHDYSWTSQLRFSFNNYFYNDRRGFETSSEFWQQAPVITLTNELGYISEDRYFYNRIRLDVDKKFMLSIFGMLDANVHCGYVLGEKVPFTKLFIPETNHSYRINKNVFCLMSEMEFISDKYIEWHLTHHFNGLIINRLPLLKKTKIRGVISFHGLAGLLSKGNNPIMTSGLYDLPYVYYPKGADEPVPSRTNFETVKHKYMPYMEITAGIENIFKILRIDYVRRLTHTEGLGGWQINSIRFSFRATL